MDGSPDSITIPIFLNLSREHAWDLLWRPEGQRHWLGSESNIKLKKNCRVTLFDDNEPWRDAILLQCKDLQQVEFRVKLDPVWGLDGSTNLTIQVADSDKPDECIVIIEEFQIPLVCRPYIIDYWERRKRHLERLDKQINRRRENPRQAVILVHGMGEQQPGQMLYNFLESGVLGKNASKSWIKPDHLSKLFELRTATLNADQLRPTTVVYEVYWAHIIRGTKFNQVASWLVGLILRWPVKLLLSRKKKGISWEWQYNIPKSALPLWLMTWSFLVLTLLSFILVAITGGSVNNLVWFISFPVLAIILKGLWNLLALPLATDYLGDAARYLRPDPENIAYRQEIREKGVELLEAIHNSGKFDRIILVGHSLGSVIAYDILSFAWGRMRKIHQCPATKSSPIGSGPFHSLREVEKAAAGNLKDVDKAQMLQHEAWRSMRINTQPWLVTDLVTIGSPLTYAQFLLADNPKSFKKLKENRSIPVCPPWPEKCKVNSSKSYKRPPPKLRFSYEQAYRNTLQDETYSNTFTVCNHGALFAVTRWTNVYTQVRHFGLSGDLVSGPLCASDSFGDWILDKEVKAQNLRFMHTWYWNKRRGKKTDIKARLTVVEDALRLSCKKELRVLNMLIPAFTFLDKVR